MREYTIRRFNGWDGVEALSIDTRLWCPEVDIEPKAQIAWDDDGLYVRLTAREAHIRAEHTAPDGMPCEDSCLEFFFKPFEDDLRYINIEFNPNGVCWLGVGAGDGSRDLIRMFPERDWLTPRTFRTDDGWGVEYRVPFRFVRMLFPGFQPKAGDAMRANCFKCGDLTEVEHYFSWNPVTCEKPDFHRPQDFGRMVFA